MYPSYHTTRRGGTYFIFPAFVPSTFGMRCVVCLVPCEHRAGISLSSRTRYEQSAHTLGVVDVDGWKVRFIYTRYDYEYSVV